LGTDARNLLEPRADAGLAAPGAVALYGEAMRFVPDLLDEMEPGMVRAERHRACAARHEQLLLPGLSCFAFRHRHEREVAQPQSGKPRTGRGVFPLPAVYRPEARPLPPPRHDFPVTARQHLAHRPVIVARFHAGDVVAAIFAFLHRRLVVDDAGSD